MSKIKLVLLDAGHGGIFDGKVQTEGKRSPIWEDGSQYFEGVGNRQIRDELAKLLNSEGIRFKYINEGEKDMSLETRVLFANSFAKKYKPEELLLISIHSDAFADPKAHGWSCFSTKGHTLSDTYSEALYEEFEKLFIEETQRVDKTDGDRDKEEQFYILKHTICPAILSENFFMTNERECKEILMTKQGRRKIALVHFNMIKRFV